MPRYELNRLGDVEFENLLQALIKEIIGDGTITFGAGPDGGREATFEGAAPYPSSVNQWSGTWIFQAKFHDTELRGVDKCRAALIKDVSDELEKITGKYNRRPDNYIVATNVPLTPTPESGTIDTILRTIFPKYRGQIKHLAIWGADDINRFLEKYPKVRTSYLHMIVPGDLIAWFLDERQRRDNEIATTIKSYLLATFGREQNAQMDQAGDVADKPVKLQRVFFELHVTLTAKSSRERRSLNSTYPQLVDYIKNENITPGPDRPIRLPVVQLFLASGYLRVVLIGGPGEGKSTAGQYLAQLHRAQLLGEIKDVAISEAYYPSLPRLPFRVILRDFGQWLSESHDTGGSNRNGTLDEFICDQIERVSARNISADTLHEVLRKNPILLILDGLDEITDPELKKNVTDRADEFVTRCEKILKADLQVLATTRPTGYNDQFSPDTFVHLTLTDLEPEQVRNYVERLILARDLDDSRAQRLRRGIEDCLHDRQIMLLMNTPLQVTILVLIITAGGTPPRQREALFNEYLEVIYKREQGKGSDIITTSRELLVGLHKYIGYELQERATRASATDATLTTDDYSRLVEEFIAWNDPYSPKERTRSQLRSITIDSGERLVLIVEPSAGRFGFELRSLQEFFAACHLVDTSKDTVQRYQRFEAIARFPHWQNVALFFAGRVGRNYPGEAANIVEVCKNIDRDGVDIYIRRGAQLALDIAFDRAFLPNRRLQRSVLEVALEVLECELTWQRRQNVAKLLRDMPGEDISDHVIPLLERKLSALAPQRLANTLHVITIIDPANEAALDAMQRMMRDPISRAQVMQPLLRVAGTQPDSFPLLKDLTSTLSAEQLGEQLAQLQGVEEYASVLSIFRRAMVSTEAQHAVVRSAARQPVALTMGSPSSTVRNIVCVRPEEQSGSQLLLRSVEAVAICRGGAESSRQKIANETIADIFDAYRKALPTMVIAGDGAGFADATGISEDHPLLVHMWILHLLLGDVTSESMQRAIEFFRTNRHDDYVRSAMTGDWHATPIFDYIVSRLSTGDDGTKMVAVLMKWSGVEGVRRWRTFRNHIYGDAAKRRRKASPRQDATDDEGAHVTTEKDQVWHAQLLQEAGDLNLLIYAATDFRIERNALTFALGDASRQVDAVFADSCLTAAKRLAIRQLCHLGNSDGVDAFELRGLILRKLLAADISHDDIIDSVLVSCYEVGVLDRALASQTLKCIGQRPNGISYIVMTPGASTSELYQEMLHFATSAEDAEIRRGAYRVIYGTSFSYTMYYDREHLRSPRFLGLANLHRDLCNSTDREARMAAIGLFSVRKTWPQGASNLIRILFQRCESDDEVLLLSRLIENELQFGKHRLALWKQTLTDLLGYHLYGPLNVEVQDALTRVLQTTNQSIEASQQHLGLPLTSDVSR